IDTWVPTRCSSPTCPTSPIPAMSLLMSSSPRMSPREAQAGRHGPVQSLPLVPPGTFSRDSLMTDDPIFDPAAITRPDDALLTYYIIVSLATLVLFPIVFLPYFIRFRTMRYCFDDEGVSMSWGFFFRKEVYLTYRRVQDIHVTRNIVE